jgi:hypothetical protein
MKSIIEEFLKMTTPEVLNRYRELPGAVVGNNFVFIPGTRDKDKRILLVGHADTVFSGPPGSVEWLGNIAKAGSAWSSKNNSSSSSSSSTTYSTKKKKKEEPKPPTPEPPKATVVSPITNVLGPSSRLEMVKDFAVANGYSMYQGPDLRFTKAGKTFTLDEFIAANMATMKGKVKAPAPVHKVKLSRDDVKNYARKLGYIPFWGRGEKEGEICFCPPSDVGKPERIQFDVFVRQHSKELLKLLDEKNKVNESLEPEDYIAGVRHGVYSTKEERAIEDFINALSQVHWRNRIRQMVDDLKAQGMLTDIEQISKALVRWARKDFIAERADPKPDKPQQVAVVKVEPKPEPPKPVDGQVFTDIGLVKGFLDDDYKGFDPTDVFDIAKRLKFSTLYTYSLSENKYTVTFSGKEGTARWAYRAFVDHYIHAIRQNRMERLRLNTPMWPFGDDKIGKKREAMVGDLARKLGYATRFGNHTMVLTHSGTDWELVDWILFEYEEYSKATEEFEKEFADKKEAKFSKNAIKKATKLAAKLGAYLNAEKGTVTYKGIEMNIHDFRMQHDKRYAASCVEKKPISQTTSVVTTTPTRAGYGQAVGAGADEWEGYGNYSYSGSGANRGLGADDRVGIAMIWMFRNSGHSILITDGEEKGCIGAREAAVKIKDELSEHLFAIEIDRNWDQEMVFYDVGTAAFKEYMVKQTKGFHIAVGSFTDICPVCNAAGICGVNLAAGYWNQHTSSEMFSYDAWLRTYNVVRAMLYEREHPRFELPKPEAPKYQPPKHIHARTSIAPSGTTPSMASATAVTEREVDRVLEDEALVGDDPRVMLGEDWIYDDEDHAFFPRSNSASSAIAVFAGSTKSSESSPTQDDDLTGRDLPNGDAALDAEVGSMVMASLQAQGDDEVSAEVKVKNIKVGVNASVAGLSVPPTKAQRELLEMHHLMVS